MKNTSPENIDVFFAHYAKNDDFYVLKPEYSSFDIEELIWSIPEHTEGFISDAAIDEFIRSIHTAALAQDEDAMHTALSVFLNTHSLSRTSSETVKQASSRLFELGEFS